MGNVTMSAEGAREAILPTLDDETRLLVRVSAVVAAGSEAQVRTALAAAHGRVRAEWVEEVVLQSYLFAGFPRTLNAAREWRRISGLRAPETDEGERFEDAAEWTRRGDATCAAVYGPFYARLRHNIRELHPALDSWMITDGYGKVLARPQLDLPRRELCVVAACSMALQSRQLHSHLHGALHVGASPAAVAATLDAIADLVPPDELRGHYQLFARVLGK